MITRFYTTTFTVRRMIYAENKSSESEVGSFSGHIQQANPELVAQMDLVYTKSYSVWCDIDTDVQEGDTIVQGSNTYSVKAVQSNNVGSNKHLELIIEKDV